VERPVRPRATYSIVARDDDGSLGVAVQSHWFNVGAVVPWAEAEVGAVAVQSFSGPEVGRAAMDLLWAGRSAEATLEELANDEVQARGGQIAVVTPDGGVAVHTGMGCIPEAGHSVGEAFSAQANLMGSAAVWPAMGAAFSEAAGDLAERMLVALEAAEAAGGDVRGRQSAALVVVEPGRPAPLDRIFDLRVEDHPDPVTELRRLVTIRRAYRRLNEGDQLVARGEVAAALDAYREATEIVDDAVADGEAAFWTAVALIDDGAIEDAETFLARAGAHSDRWAMLLPRLIPLGMLPDDAGLLARLARALTRSKIDEPISPNAP
jgi:uncharacterized Ntn-hydrolase superfamily protein